MRTRNQITPLLVSCFVLALGLACDKPASESESNTPSEATPASEADQTEQADQAEFSNLCEEYKSCNGCIAGQMSEGQTEGEAETQCALAVTGCWATWDKPVVCGDETYDEQPA